MNEGLHQSLIACFFAPSQQDYVSRNHKHPHMLPPWGALTQYQVNSTSYRTAVTKIKKKGNQVHKITKKMASTFNRIET